MKSATWVMAAKAQDLLTFSSDMTTALCRAGHQLQAMQRNVSPVAASEEDADTGGSNMLPI